MATVAILTLSLCLAAAPERCPSEPEARASVTHRLAGLTAAIRTNWECCKAANCREGGCKDCSPAPIDAAIQSLWDAYDAALLAHLCAYPASTAESLRPWLDDLPGDGTVQRAAQLGPTSFVVVWSHDRAPRQDVHLQDIGERATAFIGIGGAFRRAVLLEAPHLGGLDLTWAEPTGRAFLVIERVWSVAHSNQARLAAFEMRGERVQQVFETDLVSRPRLRTLANGAELTSVANVPTGVAERVSFEGGQWKHDRLPVQSGLPVEKSTPRQAVPAP